MNTLPPALEAFRPYRQFVNYEVSPRNDGTGKSDKWVVNPRTGLRVSAHDSTYWMSFDEAAATGRPVGFVFTENDPFWFLDIDGCLQPDNTWSPLALNICSNLNGCAVERSLSGTGLHIFGVGTPPPHACRNDAAKLEFYHKLRFVALTGDVAVGNAATDASAILPALVEAYFKPDETNGEDVGWSDGPVSEWNGPTDDAELLRRAIQSKSVASAFGTRASFADLWFADIPKLALAYPDENGRPYNESSADGGLAQHLAFWTGKDCERIERLMWQSALVRDKWTQHRTYLRELTIQGAVARQIDVLQDKPSAVPNGSVLSLSTVPTLVDGNTILGTEAELALFAGSIYISESHRAFIPGGKILKPDQFRVHYGGYLFQMDPMNERTSRDAWEAWTQSRTFRCPKVDGTCFKPGLETGSVMERWGQTFVNTYVPVDVPRKQGDASPFLRHLAKVLPDPHDREILLSYMAACVQHKGVKFQWAPLLQGVEGNGKTLFTRCVAEAIGRRYVHFPPANEISEKFNSWLFDSIFIGVEDIYVPNQKQEVFEILKPMITSDYLAKRAMQTDQVMREVVANFIFNSNHKDGLKKTRNDRRVCILFCAQQELKDLSRDGMNGDYFQELYRWLRAEGYAIVTEYLNTYAIAEAYNPATECQRAPSSSSTEEAIRASAGGIEQEIEEAVAQGLQGFCGGWISSIFLDRLLDRLGRAGRITHTKRKEMLEQMGYRYHPALTDGRVNNIVTPDGGKPRLFIHESSLSRQITSAGEAAKNYQDANNRALAVGLTFAHRA